jgi:hypothetical protein
MAFHIYRSRVDINLDVDFNRFQKIQYRKGCDSCFYLLKFDALLLLLLGTLNYPALYLLQL